MKLIKHFIKVAGYYINRVGCKHKDIGEASCPFTGMTYSTCQKCYKRISVRKTESE